MDDIYAKLGANVKLWQFHGAPTTTSVNVIESWLDHSTGEISTGPRNITIRTDFQAWLEETSRPNRHGKGHSSLVLRLVEVKVDQKTGCASHLADKQLKLLLSGFGLVLANKYLRSFVTGVVSLPEETIPHGHRQAHAFSYAPKLASIWSCTRRLPPYRRSNLIQGLIFTPEKSVTPPETAPIGVAAINQATGARPDGKPTRRQDEEMKDKSSEQLNTILCSRWRERILTNDMFPAYVFALLLGVQIDLTQQALKSGIQGIESRTGHHTFESRKQAAASGEWSILSADASGYATKLASVQRKSKTLEQLFLAVSKSAAKEHEEGTGPNLLQSQVDVMKYRHDMQILDTEYLVKRVEIQIQALYHLSTQQDTLINLRLSHHMAQTAEFSYRDAASMKTLAVVTMFFLPGSFVSALFSTELFAWDDVDTSASSIIGVPSTPQMKLYWAVTIPLTIVTFVLYFLWLAYQKNERKKRSSRATKDEKIFLGDKDAEERKLDDSSSGSGEGRMGEGREVAMQHRVLTSQVSELG